MSHIQTMSDIFEQQVDSLIQKDYPSLLGITAMGLKKQLETLKSKLPEISKLHFDLEQGKVPFVIVVQSQSLKAEDLMSRLDFHTRSGVVSMKPRQPEDFKTIENVTLPLGFAYVISDIDRGKEFLNITPESALQTILKQQRSPLTINEGIAVLTHYPNFLQKKNCFSLLASRSTDQRVPALWISEKRPKLGWCWDRNPHTWLGSTSCQHRLGIS